MANTKPFFWESKAHIKTLQNFSPYIWVSYKFVLKSVKSLNRILWATECWFKALKCQIWLTNTKPFSWENEANLETLQKLSMYVSFLSICFEVCQKPKPNLSWKARQTLKLSKKFLPIFEFSINLFRNLGNISVDWDYYSCEFFECWIFNCQIFNWR